MIAIRTLRKIWLSGLAGLVAALGWLAIVPNGSITYQADLLSPDFFIGRLSPAERVQGASGRAARQLIGEPVYFSLFTSRPFRQAEVTVEFSGRAPLIEVGLRRGATVWNFERQPLRHDGLAALAATPNALQENGLLLWQREKKYSSIAQFLKDPPPAADISAYNYDLPIPFRPAGRISAGPERPVAAGLRGAYIIETYSSGEAIDIAWRLRDINENKDSDPVIATVYNDAHTAVASVAEPDDGGAPDSVSGQRTMRLRTATLRPGVYRIEFKATDDIITDRISTGQAYFSFLNRIWLAAAGRSAVSMVTDGAYLTAQTSAPTSRQAIVFDGGKLELAETYRQATRPAADQSRRPKRIELSRDDVTLSTDGALAFSEAELINASPRQFTAGADAAAQASPYVIARYAPPAAPDQGRATFQLAGAYREKGKYSFLIAAPGVSPDQPLEIRSIRVRLSGPSIWEYGWPAVAHYLSL